MNQEGFEFQWMLEWGRKNWALDNLQVDHECIKAEIYSFNVWGLADCL